MEAALLHSSVDHQGSISSSKRVRNPKRGNQTRPLIPSRTNSNIGNLYYYESSPKMEMMFNPPFPLSSSLPRLNSSPYPLQFHQPPLLPLPMSSSRQFRSLPTSGGTSPNHKKPNKGNKRQTNAKPSKMTSDARQYLATKSDISRLGPDPESLPKDLTKAIFCSDFPQAPPPSSLPMPSFSLKPKLSCKVEATTGVGRADAVSANNNLYRLLNLR